MYDYSVSLRDREIKFRKWKVKDRNKFKAAFNAGNDPKILEQALVFDCLEDPTITLTPEEYRYLMIRIRKESIGNNLHYEFGCKHCGTDYEFDIDLEDTFKPSVKPYGVLKSGNTEFEMGEIQNLKLYKEEVSKFQVEEERILFDFLMHVKRLNGSDAFRFEDLFNFVNDMDLNVADDIFNQWNEMKFNLIDTRAVQCPNCAKIENIRFDIMPGFLPENWSN